MNDFQRCSLFLTPVSSQFAIEDFDTFCTSLATTGLTGNAITNATETSAAEQRFVTGSKYLDLVAYMGCSPAINTEANEDEDAYCYIRVFQKEIPELIFCRTRSKPPACPQCKTPYPALKPVSSSDGTYLLCPQCGTRSTASEINWRKQAGYARLFIEITDIFPKEAIPQQSLLDTLQTISGTSWQYFYSCR